VTFDEDSINKAISISPHRVAADFTDVHSALPS
jgi:hypothetical protein